MIHIENLVKRYGDLIALDHLNLDIKEGEIFGLLGPNGSGKSTAIGCMLALLKYDKGTIQIFGKNMTPDSYDIKKEIGVVMQNVAVFPQMSVRENVDYFCGLYVTDKQKRKKLVDEALDFVGLTEYAKKRPGKLSGGLLRRLNIACGIAHKPKLIIMDEPTVAVDPQSRNRILEGILELNRQGSTIIYTSHYMEEVEAICNKIVIIDSANIIACGTIDEIRKQISVKQNISIEYLGEPAQAMRAAEELKGIRFVDNVQVSEQKITCTLTSRSEDLFSIIRPIANAGVKIVNINSTEMKLQDIFLSLTGKDLRDE